MTELITEDDFINYLMRVYGLERIIRFVIKWHKSGYQWDEIDTMLTKAIKTKTLDYSQT